MPSQEQIELAQQANAELFNAVYVPTFIRKCAEAGINFSDETEVVTALTSAAELRQREAAHAKKASVHQMAAAALGINATPGAADEIVKFASALQLNEQVVAAAELLGTISAAN